MNKNRLTKIEKKALFNKVMAVYNSMPNASYNQVSDVLNKNELKTLSGMSFNGFRLSSYLTRYNVYRNTPEKKKRNYLKDKESKSTNGFTLNFTDVLVQIQMVLEMEVSDIHKFNLVKTIINSPNIVI